ncbi:MAG: hypothetical protein CVT83_01835 [Alphaproteobacteria bacterium HGW-Alphaproteobacteria-5]|nr:MAG: hypothetical protein CVT83_01835 [Alphaproteobacteria bacterium HGW-Alphaproteobacteria-5]
MNGFASIDTDFLIGKIRQLNEEHRQYLPEMAQLAGKIEAVHAEHPDVPKGLAGFLQLLTDDLQAHTKMEEAALFPAMRQGQVSAAATPVSEFRNNRDDHERRLSHLEVVTDHFTAPSDGCRSWTSLYDSLKVFSIKLRAQIRLENEIVFPQLSDRGDTNKK